MDQASKSPLPGTRITARAFFVAERINTAGLERGDVLSTAPLAFRVGDDGVAVLFRYGVVVMDFADTTKSSLILKTNFK